ncbi:MAG: DUF4190 domain-containing protein [Phycisphaerales bacterium JB040]
MNGQTMQQSGNGVLILVLGILSLVVCAPLGIVAWLMGRGDLKKIDAGVIAQDARGLTMAGMVCGIIGTILFALQLLIVIIWVFIAVLAVGASAAGSP